MPSPIEIEYSEQGYLLLPGELARQHFPNDSLVLLVKGEELWMMPTRGPAAGGLLLKQRNPAGDRSVLAAPYLPADVKAGRWPAFWDERAGAMRVAFRAAPQFEPAIAAKAVVIPENGRWVVYLDLGFSAPDSSEIRIERRRISDFSSEERARVSATWIERTADRNLPANAARLGY